MKTRTYVLLATGGLLLAACVPSVHPFYTVKDLAFDQQLLGEWHEKGKTNNAQIWRFEKNDADSYKLTVTEEDGKTGQLSAHLFKLHQDYFLDLIPTDVQFGTNQAGLVAACMFPGHLLARVSQFDPDLRLAFFDFDWLEKFLDQNPEALAHHKQDNGLLLTASTPDLQTFVLKHLNELFSKPGEFTRKPD